MGRSRRLLKEAHPELYASLERSWEIALNEWLPALGVQRDSFNSYPHLRNLEIHFDKLLEAAESLPGRQGVPVFSPLEFYVMLASILFHDIGRLHGETEHHKASHDIIRKEYAALGIISKEMAFTIANICYFHDVPPSEARGEIAKLSTVVIDPFGTVRERECAVVLCLIDHLDGAFTRVLPEYIKSYDKIEPVGAFRRVVRGVETDLEGQLVKVVLGEDAWRENKNNNDNSGIQLVCRIRSSVDQIKKNTPKKGGKIVTSIPLANAVLYRPPKKQPADELPQFGHVEWAIVQQIVFMKRKKTGGKEAPPGPAENLDGIELVREEKDEKKVMAEPWERKKLLAVLMGNTLENVRALSDIRDILSSIGIPLQRWFLEYKEHLFNYCGEETCEPVFFKDYLFDVATSMWKLSTEILGQNEFNFEALAGQMREPDVKKISRAVRRLDILTRANDINQVIGDWRMRNDAFWVGQSTWKWRIGSKGNSRSKRMQCDFVTIKEVRDRISLLADPSEADKFGKKKNER